MSTPGWIFRTGFAALGAALFLHAGAALAAPCEGFADVADTDPFCPSIAWMKNRGITFGCGTGANYCPADLVRRDQMAAFMYRLGFQNAFLNGGNSFPGPVVIGNQNNEILYVVINGSQVARFDSAGLSAETSSTTGTAPALEGRTNSTDLNAVAVRGEVTSSNAGGNSVGVLGVHNASGLAGAGVRGSHLGGGVGVRGESASYTGVFGSAGTTSGRGVFGGSNQGIGVQGGSTFGIGVDAISTLGSALTATSAGLGLANATAYIHNTDTTAGEPAGIAIYARNHGGDATIVTHNAGAGDAIRVLNQAGNALVFRVTGNGTVRADGSYNCGLASNCFNTGSGADLAERIDATEALRPGDVVEIDPDAPGQYRRSRTAASTLVAGVVSGRPAITMNNNDLAAGSDVRTDDRPLIALVGTVEVRASAENGAIRAGDLLVSASKEGAAMRGGERSATGTVIGKALTPLAQGTGTVSMLVMLR